MRCLRPEEFEAAKQAFKSCFIENSSKSEQSNEWCEMTNRNFLTPLVVRTDWKNVVILVSLCACRKNDCDIKHIYSIYRMYDAIYDGYSKLFVRRELQAANGCTPSFKLAIKGMSFEAIRNLHSQYLFVHMFLVVLCALFMFFIKSSRKWSRRVIKWCS